MSGFDNSPGSHGAVSYVQMWGSILRGMGPPVTQTGVPGSVYIDTQSWEFYERRSGLLTNPWGNPIFVVPVEHRTGLKWFSVDAPSDKIGVVGDYCLLWGSYANYGMRASFYGPKNAFGWPENGTGGPTDVAFPGDDVLPLGLSSEGAPLPESTSSQLIALGLDSEVILTYPVNDGAGSPVDSVGLQSGPRQVDLTIEDDFGSLNTHEVP